MKRVITAFLTLMLALTLAGGALAEPLVLRASYGSIELADAAPQGTVRIDGRDVPVYGVGDGQRVTKYGISRNTVITVSDLTLNGDGTGTVGRVRYQMDQERFLRDGLAEFSPYAYYYYCFDDLDADGFTVYYEAKELGDTDGAVTRLVLRHVAADPAVTAFQREQTVELDGERVNLPTYAIKDANGYETNFVRIRDIAALMNGTAAQFDVGWSQETNEVGLTSKTPYVPKGSELKTPFSGNRVYQRSTAPIRIDGATANLEGILLTDDAGGGYTYFKLRDVGAALGFNVGWDMSRGIYVESNRPYQG